MAPRKTLDFGAALDAVSDEVSAAASRALDPEAVLFQPGPRPEPIVPREPDGAIEPERTAPVLADRDDGGGEPIAVGPTPRRRKARTVPLPVEPAAEEPIGEVGSVYIPVGTYVPVGTEAALHAAAFARGGRGGGIEAKSLIVRETLDSFLDRLDGLSRASTGTMAAEVTRIRAAAAAAGPRMARMYRLTRETRERLVTLNAEHRLPAAAAIRAALVERFGE